MDDEKAISEAPLGDTDKILTTAPIAKDDKVTEEKAKREEITLPPACQRERIEWSNVNRDVAYILSKSYSMEDYLEQINPRKGNLDILKSPSSHFNTLAQTGRSPRDPTNRKLVAFEFVWDKIESRFQLAFLMAHEYKHAKLILERGFTQAEAAPFLEEEQYLVLKWWSEYEAYEFQANVLKEIIDTETIFKPCAEKILKDDIRIRYLLENNLDKVKMEIVKDYTVDQCLREYSRYKSDCSEEEIIKLKDVKDKVDYLVKTEDWKNQEAIWRSFYRK